MLEDGKIKWHAVNYTLAEPATMTDGWSSSPLNPSSFANSLLGQLSAVIGSITAAMANAVSLSTNLDDILAIARTFSHKDREKPLLSLNVATKPILTFIGFVPTLVSELVRHLRVNVDYSDESPSDQLIRNSQMQVCSSVLHHLGWKGEYQPREFSSKLALVMLNLRNIVIVITIAHTNTSALKGAGTPMDDPGTR